MTFRYVIQELRHHHHRTLVNIMGVALGIALFVAINALAAAYQDALQLPFRNVGADLVLQKPEKRQENAAMIGTSMQGIRLPFSNQLISATELEKLEKLGGISSKAASLLLWEFSSDGFRTIMGLDSEQPGLGPVKVKDWIAEGRFLQQKGDVILEKHYAKFKNAKLNDTVTIGNRPFKVVGLLAIKEGAQIASANTYMSIEDARSVLDKDPEGVNLVYLRLKDPSTQGAIKSQIEQALPGMSMVSADSSLEVMGGISKISSQFAMIVSFVAVCGAILLIIRSMVSNLITRTNQIGILKAIGWTSADVRKQITVETLIQSMGGGILGLFLGYVVAYILGTVPVSMTGPALMNQMPSIARNSETALSNAVSLPVQLSSQLIFYALIISLLAGILASYLMGKRTDKMKPADIMREL